MLPTLTDDRGQVDDVPGDAFEHVPHSSVRHEELPQEVARNDLVLLVVAHLQDGLVQCYRGIVDEDVELATFVEHFLHNPSTVVRRGDVGAPNRAAAEARLNLRGVLVGAFDVTTESGSDPRGVCCKAGADGCTDPTDAASDQRHSTGEFFRTVPGPSST